MPQATAETDFIYSEFGGDPDMADLVELYVDEMPSRVSDLKQLASQKSWDEIGRLAHQIKGSAGGYGFGQVTETALRLEQAVRIDGQEETILAALSELVEMCGNIRSGTA